MTSGYPAMAVLGLAGGLLHVWNHSLMKGLLFLSAGSVLHGTGTKDIERLGGLMSRMPWTGTAMTVGVVAISGLPPLNGFVSEWLIYLGVIRGGLATGGVHGPVLFMCVGLVALIGGLALACFVRLTGTVLLGAGRSDQARHAHESSRWLIMPIGALAVLCVCVGLFPRLTVTSTLGVAEQVVGIKREQFLVVLDSAESPLGVLGLLNVAVWTVIGLVASGLVWLRRRGIESSDATWGCGYAQPTARMQYTGASFAQLMVGRVFPQFLRNRTAPTSPTGLFPRDGTFVSESPDPISERMYEPFFNYLAERFARLRWVQQGKIHFYLLYIMAVVVLSFVWISVRAWVGP
jgi:NADH:ubiquinone oxidoreductase subunit 5 (subunit L)/multisubunit Na+/H+ antiporter MnhA subunit